MGQCKLHVHQQNSRERERLLVMSVVAGLNSLNVGLMRATESNGGLGGMDPFFFTALQV